MKRASRTIKLPMGYIPNIQYAPFYVAVDKGYFAEEGIEIEFDYSFETDGVKLVGAGELPFAVASGEQVLVGAFAGTARGVHLCVVSAISHFGGCKPELNINEPADLKGKKIGLPGLFGANYIGLRSCCFLSGCSPKMM
jgi:NitT/TauT family transport system substrate-binding protein